MALLTEQGIRPVGLTRGGTNRQEPVVVEVHGLRIGFLAYSGFYPPKFLAHDPRPAKSDWVQIQQDLQALDPLVDFIVVSMHWGKAHEDTRPVQRDLGRRMVDLGAHVVVGHGPHVLQAPERYGHGLILYSLGNFVFVPDRDPQTAQSTLTRVTLRLDQTPLAESLPLRIDGFRPVPTEKEFAPH